MWFRQEISNRAPLVYLPYLVGLVSPGLTNLQKVLQRVAGDRDEKNLRLKALITFSPSCLEQERKPHTQRAGLFTACIMGPAPSLSVNGFDAGERMLQYVLLATAVCKKLPLLRGTPATLAEFDR